MILLTAWMPRSGEVVGRLLLQRLAGRQRRRACLQQVGGALEVHLEDELLAEGLGGGVALDDEELAVAGVDGVADLVDDAVAEIDALEQVDILGNRLAGGAVDAEDADDVGVVGRGPIRIGERGLNEGVDDIVVLIHRHRLEPAIGPAAGILLGQRLGSVGIVRLAHQRRRAIGHEAVDQGAIGIELVDGGAIFIHQPEVAGAVPGHALQVAAESVEIQGGAEDVDGRLVAGVVGDAGDRHLDAALVPGQEDGVREPGGTVGRHLDLVEPRLVVGKREGPVVADGFGVRSAIGNGPELPGAVVGRSVVPQPGQTAELERLPGRGGAQVGEHVGQVDGFELGLAL